MVGSKVGMSKSKHCVPPILSSSRLHGASYFISWHTDAYFLSTSPSSLESADPEFDDYQRNFAVLETAAEKFLKDTKAFTDAVNSMCHVCLLFYEPMSPSPLRQSSSRPEAVSPSISLSSSILSLPSMTSSVNSLRLRTRSRTLTRTIPRWRSCVRQSALSSS
jgi:hypothetical protein